MRRRSGQGPHLAKTLGPCGFSRVAAGFSPNWIDRVSSSPVRGPLKAPFCLLPLGLPHPRSLPQLTPPYDPSSPSSPPVVTSVHSVSPFILSLPPSSAPRALHAPHLPLSAPKPVQAAVTTAPRDSREARLPGRGRPCGGPAALGRGTYFQNEHVQ